MNNRSFFVVAEVYQRSSISKLSSPQWICGVACRGRHGIRVLKSAVTFALTGAILLSAGAARAGGIDPARSRALLKTLNSPDTSFYEKARACQQAGEFGTAELVPPLAKLLADEKLSAYARSGLENISDAAASAALRDALGELKGGLLVGVINSLGVIRDQKAVPALRKLATAPKSAVSEDALLALGRIANASAVETLLESLRRASAELRAAGAAGCLLAAQSKMKLKEFDEARKLYEAVNAADVATVYKAGAVRGMIVSRKSEGPAFLTRRLLSADAEVRKAARLAAREFSGKAVVAQLYKALNEGAVAKRDLVDDTLRALYYKPLIIGKRFQGWEGDTKKSFRMRKGCIVAGDLKNAIPRNEFLATKREYTNFMLRVECKLVGEKCNAGIQFRTQRIPGHHEVSGYQADMSTGENGGYWGKLYDESRREKMLGETLNHERMIEKLNPDGWNQYEIHCDGRRVKLFLNGVQTLDYIESDNSIPRFGIIAVQIHSGPPSQAWYRDIQIVELP